MKTKERPITTSRMTDIAELPPGRRVVAIVAQPVRFRQSLWRVSPRSIPTYPRWTRRTLPGRPPSRPASVSRRGQLELPRLLDLGQHVDAPERPAVLLADPDEHSVGPRPGRVLRGYSVGRLPDHRAGPAGLPGDVDQQDRRVAGRLSGGAGDDALGYLHLHDVSGHDGALGASHLDGE